VDRVHLGIRNRLGFSARTNEIHNAERLENPQPIRVQEAREAVTWKQRDLDPLDPVLPPAASFEEGQEHVDARPVGELRAHLLLVS
jgi:hypothetical protein